MLPAASLFHELGLFFVSANLYSNKCNKDDFMYDTFFVVIAQPCIGGDSHIDTVFIKARQQGQKHRPAGSQPQQVRRRYPLRVNSKCWLFMSQSHNDANRHRAPVQH